MQSLYDLIYQIPRKMVYMWSRRINIINGSTSLHVPTTHDWVCGEVWEGCSLQLKRHLAQPQRSDGHHAQQLHCRGLNNDEPCGPTFLM